MIVVDNLGFVQSLPWWTYHMPREADGMTYVDTVFPAFLFLMGMSLPLSVNSRIAKGQSKSQIWLHVIRRSLSLVVLGLFISNAPQVDAHATRISRSLWTTLGFIAIGLVWGHFPGILQHKRVAWFTRCAGLTLLSGLAIIFRRATPEGHMGWIDFSDWEILGLLGWAYFAVAAVYLIFQKKTALLFSALAVFITMNAMSVAGYLSRLETLPPYLRPFEAGLTSITMAGLLASLLIIGDTIVARLKAKVVWTLTFAVVLLFVGRFLRGLGISKLRDTPTWCLYCMSANVVIAMLLYWLADVRHGLRWTTFAKVVGANALLAYFLPYLAYLLPMLWPLTADGTSGWLGVVWSLLFAAGILAIVSVSQRARITLQV